MTMPHLTNCSHSADGWCLACVKELWEDKQHYKKGVTSALHSYWQHLDVEKLSRHLEDIQFHSDIA